MPVEVVDRPSMGEGRTPGLGWGAGGWRGEGVEGPARATFLLRKDMEWWRWRGGKDGAEG